MLLPCGLRRPAKVTLPGNSSASCHVMPGSPPHGKLEKTSKIVSRFYTEPHADSVIAPSACRAAPYPRPWLAYDAEHWDFSIPGLPSRHPRSWYFGKFATSLVALSQDNSRFTFRPAHSPENSIHSLITNLGDDPPTSTDLSSPAGQHPTLPTHIRPRLRAVQILAQA